MYLIKPYENELLRMRVMRDVAFSNMKGQLIAMPDMAVRAFAQASVERAAPLVAIVEHPVITPDGRLITGTGYDPTTGLYLTIPPTIIPRWDDPLHRVDACVSLHWLRTQYLAEYPFATPCDLDAAIALSLTLLERVFVAGPNGFPGFSLTAPTQGSGKTTLFNQACYAVLGRTAAASSWTANSEEMAKIIIALLLEGQSFVLFDNLPEGKPFSSDEVAKLMTSEMYKGRILGANKIVTAAANVFVGFTGNNITPADDFATRVLQIELKPDTENPDRRTFARPEIIDWTATHRAEIIFHLCVLVAAYLRSGDTSQGTPTRFALWDRLVRYPIIWAGGHDVADLFERNRVEDPHRQANATFLSAWMTCYESAWTHVRDVVDAIEKDMGDSEWTNLRQSIEGLLGRAPLTSQSLAGLLKRLENKIIDGMRLEHEPSNEESQLSRRPRPWCVKRVGS